MRAIIFRGHRLTPPVPPSPTRLPTTTPTAALPSVTVTPSATATPTVTATPTACPPDQPRVVDVALVIDRSGSMKGAKLADAKSAASRFVELLDLGQNQVALVSFAREARLDSPLSHDAATIAGAIDALATSGGSNIAEGIQMADAELAGANHRPDAAPVLILLSDGRADSSTAVRAAADAAKARGVQIVAIGLGDDANQPLLRAVASSPADFYQAPSSADLIAIYTAIALIIDKCPAAGATPAPTSPPAASPTPSPAAEQILCTADTYLHSGRPDQAYGEASALKASAADPERWALIGCRAPDRPARRLTLRIYIDEGGADARVFDVAGAWDERTTRRARPDLGALLAEIQHVERGAWVDVDVTAAAQTNGTLAVAILSASQDDIELASRESGPHGPRLLVER